MNHIVSAGNMKSPRVNLDPDKGIVELGGRSIPENTESVYRPLIEWIEEYKEQPQEKTVVKIDFEYFNSSSAKYLIRFLEYFSTLKKSGYEVVINWFYDDDELLEYGEDFQDVLEMKFNFYSSKDYGKF
ncbi:MAG: DUF1987 domain-containing protein [Bacteroidales bacterium]|nr:DUF1987 domain-containing protein [Bacteroidales bacterium]MBQ5538670.1 DUF1987 domain-containing protein [Bacteroidales bacterium]MBR4678700.1 DUF1987 domain-containing protein [Bacteroidales bacterium]MEE3447042.1 DUF1987 domain-containing protein [Bacteroidales bacterium]